MQIYRASVADNKEWFSSNGVDQALKQYLPEFGYACDVGANDGIFFSNTLHYENRGWLVLCVEPNPLLEQEGRLARKLWRQVAAGSDNTEMQFTACGGPPYASESGMRIGLGGQQFMVKVRKLDDLLEEAGFPRLDFLTIDCEGWEDEVMKGFTIERWKPKIIVREDWSGGRPEYPNYTWLEKREFDNIYLRNDE